MIILYRIDMKNILDINIILKERDEREPRAEKHANEMEPAAAAQRELPLTRQPTRPHTKIFRSAG